MFFTTTQQLVGKRMGREIIQRHWTERQEREREGGEKERAKYVFL